MNSTTMRNIERMFMNYEARQMRLLKQREEMRRAIAETRIPQPRNESRETQVKSPRLSKWQRAALPILEAMKPGDHITPRQFREMLGCHKSQASTVLTHCLGLEKRDKIYVRKDAPITFLDLR
jgi:hypothetical protein